MRKWMMIVWLFIMVPVVPVVAGSLDVVPMYRLEGGERVPFKLADETEYVAFYFSASWCPPCRQTTPPLVEEYQRMRALGEMPVEMVLVGADRTEDKMFDYMEKYGMNWPAVVYRASSLVDKYAASGVPHLVLVNRHSGEVVSHGTGERGIEAVVNRMRDFSKVTSDKPFRASNWLSKYGVLIAVALCFVVVFLLQKRKERKEVKNL